MKALIQRQPADHRPPSLSTRLLIEKSQSLSRPDLLRPLGLWFVVVMLLFGRAEVNGAGGSVRQRLGSPIPNSSAPGGGYQLTGLTVIIEPAEARTAGATWQIQGGASSLSSGASVTLLVADAGKRVLQFSTLPKFQAPIQPGITLTKGFGTIVTFTYARLPPVLPASANAAGTRALAFAYTPTATGGTATSYSVVVGGGETLGTLGLALNPATGRLSGIPTKTGTFSIVFTAANSGGTSQPMVLTLTVTDPGVLEVNIPDETRGSVTVSPKQPNNLYPQGETVTLTAKPKMPGFLFSEWQFTGVTPANLTSPTTSFSFSPTHLMVVATPNFIVNPFLTRVDTYTGRIAPASGVTVANTGTLMLTTTNLGQYTGKLKLGTASYSFKGQFQTDGKAPVVTIKRPNKTPPLSDLVISQLQMDLTLANSEQITGKLSADGNIITFALDRAVFATANPCPQSATDPKTGKPVAARYTLALRRDSTKPADQDPHGHGFGVATVRPNGTVRFTGSLGDGTALTQSAVISKTGGWPFHALLYGNGGVVTGDLRFREIAQASDLDGTLDWIKPVLTGATVTYSRGFTTKTSAIGSRFDKTVTVPNGTLSFGEGNLGASLNPVPVTSAHGLWTASSLVSGFSGQFAQATGLFSGTLPDVALLKSRKFQGVLLQKTQHGYGWFIGAPLPAGKGLPTGYVEFAVP